MGFNKDRGGYGKGRDDRGYGGKPAFQKPERMGFGAPTQMFPAVCDKCHKPCEVPFKSDGQRPVYCRDCFGANRGTAPVGGTPRREFTPGPRRDFSLQTPAFSAPRVEDRRIDDIKRQLDTMTAKLDKLIASMEPAKRTPVSFEVAPKETKAVGTPTAKVQKVALRAVKKAAKKVAPKKKK